MATNEYRRLGCAAAACDGKHKAHGFCLRHYRQWQRGGIKPDATNCAHCAAPFEPTKAGAMYCTKRCKALAWEKANPERCAELEARRPTPYYTGYCATCGEAWGGRRPRRYCSKACAPSQHDGRVHVLGRTYTPPVRTCKHCGCQWSAIRRIGATRYCQSDECQSARQAEARRARGAYKGHIERAKKHGRRYGHFNVLRVFARDKWTCQLCGIKTPKRLRGTLDPRAPEIDHILAISLGGDHLIENCQCACRQCNGLKGARGAGQMWLAGFADTR